MRRLTAIAAALLGALVIACRATPGDARQDRDRDGLDDHLEALLAGRFLPALHEFGGADQSDACPWPTPRPILYRARPRVSAGHVDPDSVAITYVLLYLEDCGPLGHTGDNESFTVFVHRDAGDRWRVIGAAATAHRGMPGERPSVGDGHAIRLSQDKHSPYATFEACLADDWFIDTCTRGGPPPSATVLFNVGEPNAPLTNDVGDVALAGGADGSTPPLVMPADDASRARMIEAIARARPDARAQMNLAYQLFRGQSIWKHETFLDAGDITAQLSHGPITLHLPAPQDWDAEDPLARPIIVK